MRIIRYNENMLDAYAEFWWSIYEHKPYVHRPDGHFTVNTPLIGPKYFVKHLKAGFNNAWYWGGHNITDDDVILVEDKGKIAGILVCSIEEEKNIGNIMSAYVQRDYRGPEIAVLLLSEALERFRKMGLYKAVAAPFPSPTMEVECPIFLALLDAGFELEKDDWTQAALDDYHGVWMGGSLEGFRLQPEIQEKMEKLRKEGIEIKRVTADEYRELRRYDTGDKPPLYMDIDSTFVALVDGRAVGWLSELGAFEDEGSLIACVEPEVIPSYRRRGIGKILYHLGIEENVRQGARYGWDGTGFYNPALLLYRSIGCYRHWYTYFCQISKRLR